MHNYELLDDEFCTPSRCRISSHADTESQVPTVKSHYVVERPEDGSFRVKGRGSGLLAWHLLNRVDRIVMSGQEYAAGVYAYVRLANPARREPALLLEVRTSETARQFALLAWLYVRFDAESLLGTSDSEWKSLEAIMPSTHLQIVDCDTLDGVLEKTSLPQWTHVLDVRVDSAALSPCSELKVSWLCAMFQVGPAARLQWMEAEHRRRWGKRHVKEVLSILEIPQARAETHKMVSAIDIVAREIVSLQPVRSVYCLTDDRQTSDRGQTSRSVQGMQAQRSPSARGRAELPDVVLR
ncbi:hypothetical protein LTR84_011455 [Exophiala bonariae]|uniref:Uncharacterized protein n=1 Tax=Exophiala bonariae TaxID=1690606 RepID=A0AAV9MRP6_9EURO|nr:hypothetical protein LTR84_011455 [Exophiala bonariae]